MKNKLLFTGILAFALCNAIAQKDEKEYKQRSQEIQTEIWNNAAQPFSVKTVSADLNNESAVIIATSFDVINTEKSKLKFGLMGLNAVRRLYYQTTFHERVKINDKAALEDYSTLEYQKKLDKTVSAFFFKVYNKMDTYIGAKIIKTDGKEVIVNSDEEVLTKDESRKKEGKLAIPDLQVGDILDYYLRSEKVQEYSPEVQGPYTFFLGGDYPIMYQSIHLQLDEKSGVEYVSANGAPSLNESHDNDNNIVLSLETKNLPKIQSSIYTSPYRQYPYISVQYMFVIKGLDANTHFNRGEIKHGSLSDDLLKQFKDILQNQYLTVDNDAYNTTIKYFGGERAMKNIPQDSIIKVLYDAWRHKTFFSLPTTNLSITNDNNYVTANSLIAAISLSRMLRKLGIEHDLVLVCPRTSNKLKDVMNVTDFEGMIHLKLKKDYWLCFYDMVTQFNEIPVWLQGEDGLVFQPNVDARKLSYEQSGNVKVPIDKADKNNEIEDINISFDPSNIQQLQFDRTTTLNGYIRHYTQKELMLLEDMESGLAVAVGEKKLNERLADDRKQSKLISEYSTAFAKERSNQKSYFEDEIKSQYNQAPKLLTVYNVSDAGLINTGFTYHTDFTMDNFIKKAGTNYIIDAGKLIGALSKVEEKDRTRTIDIYEPCARTYRYNITLKLPKGYAIKGIENFNKSISNETGSLTATSSTYADSVHITIQQLYANNFEPVANWQKLLQIMDGFYDISNQKLLLQKEN